MRALAMLKVSTKGKIFVGILAWIVFGLIVSMLCALVGAVALLFLSRMFTNNRSIA
jgi:hypothetical protein